MDKNLNEIASNLIRPIRELMLNPGLSVHEKQLCLGAAWQAILSGMGYNNFQNEDLTGEKGFIVNVLAPMSPKVCVDVGANCGTYSTMLLDNTSSYVFAFEPLQEPFHSLASLGSAAGRTGRFLALNQAVSNRTGTAKIKFNPSSTSFASLAEEANNVSYVDNSSEAIVETVTLDDYFHGNTAIDFIKIDTEGFEMEVLDGARLLLSGQHAPPPKAIQIEFNLHHIFRGHSLWMLAQKLKGYHAFQLLPGGQLIHRDTTTAAANIFSFSNFVFIRSDLIQK
jgi:FkbM family methyltransferase